MASLSHRRLIEWCFATFHTLVLFLVFVILTFAAGALGPALASLNTLIGVVIFGLFWLVTWLTGHRVLVGTRREIAERHELGVTTGRMFLRGAVWGGLEGILVLSVALVAFLIAGLTSSGAVITPAVLIEGLIFETLAMIVGSSFAFIIGAFVGLMYVLLDLVLLTSARLIYSGVEMPALERQAG